MLHFHNGVSEIRSGTKFNDPFIETDDHRVYVVVIILALYELLVAQFLVNLEVFDEV